MTLKPFTSHTPLVAIRTSGNVFAKDTVDRLNIKANFWRDLVTDEPFTRKDIITIQVRGPTITLWRSRVASELMCDRVQDPHNVEHRDSTKFHHIRHELKAEADNEAPALSGINVAAVGGATANHLRSMASSSSATPVAAKGKGKAKAITDGKTGAALTDDKGRQIAIAPESAATWAGAQKKAEPYNAAHYSTGRVAASLTSTSAAPVTKTDRALIDEDEFMFEAVSESHVKVCADHTSFADRPGLRADHHQPRQHQHRAALRQGAASLVQLYSARQDGQVSQCELPPPHSGLYGKLQPGESELTSADPGRRSCGAQTLRVD